MPPLTSWAAASEGEKVGITEQQTGISLGQVEDLQSEIGTQTQSATEAPCSRVGLGQVAGSCLPRREAASWLRACPFYERDNE